VQLRIITKAKMELRLEMVESPFLAIVARNSQPWLGIWSKENSGRITKSKEG
jgi:hypothetical protein